MNKKLLMTLGTITTITAPVAAVMACSSNEAATYMVEKEKGEKNAEELRSFIGNHMNMKDDGATLSQNIKIVVGDKTFLYKKGQNVTNEKFTEVFAEMFAAIKIFIKK